MLCEPVQQYGELSISMNVIRLTTGRMWVYLATYWDQVKDRPDKRSCNLRESLWNRKDPSAPRGLRIKRSAQCTRTNQQKGLQFGPRSTGQSAVGHLSWNMHQSERWRAIRPRLISSHPTLLLTRIGKLYPSTSDTKKIPSSHEDNRFNLNLSQTHRRNYPEYLGRCSA